MSKMRRVALTLVASAALGCTTAQLQSWAQNPLTYRERRKAQEKNQELVEKSAERSEDAMRELRELDDERARVSVPLELSEAREGSWRRRLVEPGRLAARVHHECGYRIMLRETSAQMSFEREVETFWASEQATGALGRERLGCSEDARGLALGALRGLAERAIRVQLEDDAPEVALDTLGLWLFQERSELLGNDPPPIDDLLGRVEAALVEQMQARHDSRGAYFDAARGETGCLFSRSEFPIAQDARHELAYAFTRAQTVYARCYLPDTIGAWGARRPALAFQGAAEYLTFGPRWRYYDGMTTYPRPPEERAEVRPRRDRMGPRRRAIDFAIELPRYHEDIRSWAPASLDVFLTASWNDPDKVRLKAQGEQLTAEAIRRSRTWWRTVIVTDR